MFLFFNNRVKVQAQWLYLDPIFSSEDIMQQMPEEGQMFQVVDSHWKQIMKNTVQQPLVGRPMRCLLRALRSDSVRFAVDQYLLY